MTDLAKLEIVANIRRVLQQKHQDVWALGSLVGIVIVFVFPLVARWAPAVFDDCPVDTLPGLIASARDFQRGSLPLWDFCTFAGAKPAYASRGLTYYLPMYPFYLLADTQDASQSHFWLMLVPYAMHLVWAALGGYAFGRLALRLQPAAAALTGLMYGLSPEMGFQLVWPKLAITLSHLPWCLLALSRFMETRNMRWWLAGTALLALMSSTGNANYLIRAYFVMALTAVGLWSFRLSNLGACRWPDAKAASEIRPREKWLLSPLGGALGMLVLSIGLTGFVWVAIVEAARWISTAVTLTADASATFSSYSSMPPLNVVSLFLPGYFGDLEMQHSWGVGLTLSNHCSLSGGMFCMVAVVGAILTCGRHGAADGSSHRLHVWTWVAALLLVASLLLMMGSHTPIYGWMCNVVPWLGFPHPVYYRFVQCWTVAVLAGMGVSQLLTCGTQSEHLKPWRRAAVGCLLAASSVAMLGIISRTNIEDPRGLVKGVWGFQTLTLFGQWGWFLSRPVPYFLITILLLGAAWYARPVRLGYWLLLLIASETLYIAWSIFYGTSYLGVQARAAPRYDHPAKYHFRYFNPQEDPFFELVSALEEVTAKQPGRFVAVGISSIYDNAAWYVNGRSVLGYSAKPLLPWYVDVIRRFTSFDEGKNEVTVNGDPGRLPSSMSVRYLVSSSDLQIPLQVVKRTERFAIYESPDAMPYAYTQDRVLGLDVRQQLAALFTADPRNAVYVEVDVEDRMLSLGRLAANRSPVAGESGFVELQKQNVVESIDQSKPNQTTIKVKIQRPAMLVIAECWHPGWTATVGTQTSPLYRVNYLQQGVWLEAGTHVVQLRFFPPLLRLGIWLSISSVVAVVFVIALWVWRSRRVPV